MPHVSSIDEFAERAEALFRDNPLQTRYSIKYRNVDGRVVLKATDDATVVMLKTDQAADLRKMERLNNRLFALMSRGVSDSTDEFLAEQLAEEHARHQANQAGGAAAGPAVGAGGRPDAPSGGRGGAKGGGAGSAGRKKSRRV